MQGLISDCGLESRRTCLTLIILQRIFIKSVSKQIITEHNEDLYVNFVIRNDKLSLLKIRVEHVMLKT